MKIKCPECCSEYYMESTNVSAIDLICSKCLEKEMSEKGYDIKIDIEEVK